MIMMTTVSSEPRKQGYCEKESHSVREYVLWQESHRKRLTGLRRASVSPKTVQKASFHSYARICNSSATVPSAATRALLTYVRTVGTQAK